LGEKVNERPRFSIIAVDYEKHVPRAGMVRGLESLAKQTFKDFELVICHDGPKETPYEDEIDFKDAFLSATLSKLLERDERLEMFRWKNCNQVFLENLKQMNIV
jgi:hypothetical protein